MKVGRESQICVNVFKGSGLIGAGIREDGCYFACVAEWSCQGAMIRHVPFEGHKRT